MSHNSPTSSQMDELGLLETRMARLEDLSDRLVLLMESQSRAVVHSDTDRLETLTEEQSGLIQQFRIEKESIESDVHELLSRRTPDVPEKSWSALMEAYPEEQARLEAWRDRLRRKTRQVTRKQQQVRELLAFARSHNEHLLKTLFRRDDGEKGSYLESGEKRGPSSGMTINREV